MKPKNILSEIPEKITLTLPAATRFGLSIICQAKRLEPEDAIQTLLCFGCRTFEDTVPQKDSPLMDDLLFGRSIMEHLRRHFSQILTLAERRILDSHALSTALLEAECAAPDPHKTGDKPDVVKGGVP